MRVLVCGGRYYSDREALEKYLDALHSESPISLVIDGGASGADTLANQWAVERHIRAASFPADWRKHGKAAGPIRNQQMLDEGKPDVVVAFPGGRGTADMVARAKRAGVPVREVSPA
jgi:SLOG family YspA-like protein